MNDDYPQSGQNLTADQLTRWMLGTQEAASQASNVDDPPPQVLMPGFENMEILTSSQTWNVPAKSRGRMFFVVIGGGEHGTAGSNRLLFGTTDSNGDTWTLYQGGYGGFGGGAGATVVALAHIPVATALTVTVGVAGTYSPSQNASLSRVNGVNIDLTAAAASGGGAGGASFTITGSWLQNGFGVYGQDGGAPQPGTVGTTGAGGYGGAGGNTLMGTGGSPIHSVPYVPSQAQGYGSGGGGGFGENSASTSGPTDPTDGMPGVVMVFY